MKVLATTAAAAALIASAAVADDAQIVLDRVSTGGLVQPVIEAPVVIPPAAPSSSIGTLPLIGIAVGAGLIYYLLEDDDTTAGEGDDNDSD